MEKVYPIYNDKGPTRHSEATEVAKFVFGI
jgi:hypothetical protein